MPKKRDSLELNSDVIKTDLCHLSKEYLITQKTLVSPEDMKSAATCLVRPSCDGSLLAVFKTSFEDKNERQVMLRGRSHMRVGR
jgi:hypothetical protein